VPSQRGLPAAQGRSLRRRGPRGFTSRCSPSRRRFRRLDTASAPRPLTNGHLLGHSQTDAAPPLSRSALRSELRPPGRAAIRVISTSSLHLKRGTAAINGPRPTGSPPRMTMTARPLHRVVLGQRRPGVWPAPRDSLILPALGGCRPQAIARCPGPESSGDSQPRNQPTPERQRLDDSGSWRSHQAP
jgi:hypothetical protein